MIFFLFKSNKSEYLNLYKVNNETKAFVIELMLDDYSELFNGWDASPVRRKEMEPELMDYFEQAATEIPLKEKLEVCFYVPIGSRDFEKEKKSINAIKRNFNVKVFFAAKELRDIYRRFVSYVFVSGMLLTSAYLLPSIGELSLFFKIMVEGMFIGGWWILWEGSSLFFFTGHDVRVKKKYFERYTRSEIYFKESHSSQI